MKNKNQSILSNPLSYPVLSYTTFYPSHQPLSYVMEKDKKKNLLASQFYPLRSSPLPCPSLSIASSLYDTILKEKTKMKKERRRRRRRRRKKERKTRELDQVMEPGSIIVFCYKILFLEAAFYFHKISNIIYYSRI